MSERKPLLTRYGSERRWTAPDDLIGKWVDVLSPRDPQAWPAMRAEYVGLLHMMSEDHAVVRPKGLVALRLVDPGCIVATED